MSVAKGFRTARDVEDALQGVFSHEYASDVEPLVTMTGGPFFDLDVSIKSGEDAINIVQSFWIMWDELEKVGLCCDILDTSVLYFKTVPDSDGTMRPEIRIRMKGIYSRIPSCPACKWN